MSLSGFEKKETEVFKCFANAKEANVTIEENTLVMTKKSSLSIRESIAKQNKLKSKIIACLSC